ncbi:MAG: polysaccharide biosynthesis tyrosine autokinase, partial [Phycisphaerales bacterium]|nr:polysaccharide biosynthesis tyrosine autokinase [Phycisphaerales bacterium]
PIVTIQDVLTIIRRRLVLIVLLFILFSGLVVGGWFAAREWFPLWPGEALVECISDRPRAAMNLRDDVTDQRDFERFVLTQAQIVESPNVLSDTLKTFEVKATDWYKEHDGSRLYLDFEELVHAAPQRGTNLLNISVATRSPKDPHVIVNKLVEQYLERAREFNVGEYRRERAAYQNDLESLSSAISDKLTQLAALQQRLPPGYVSIGTNVVAQDYAAGKAQVAELQQFETELASLVDVYRQAGGAALSPEDTQFVEAHPIVSALSNQLFAVNQQLQVERNDFGDNHEMVRRLEQQRIVIDTELTKQRQLQLGEVLRYRVAEVETRHAAAQQALLLVQEKLADSEALMADMDAVVSQYRSLEEEITLLKEKRTEMSTYIGELDRIIRERAAIRVEKRQDAIEPPERSFPRLYLIPAGIALSLLFALGIPLLLEFADTSLRTPSDIVRHLRLPLLAIVPDADDEEVNIQSLETAVRDQPQTMFAEVFRSMRTNLQFASTPDRQRSILVTSPRPEDGKTTVACNLAILCAQGGQRVLLIDANFRRPGLQRLFGLDGKTGLSNVLVGQASLADAISASGIERLDVVPTGPTPPNPAELIGSAQTARVIAEAVQRYDRVIVDAPPVLVAGDAGNLATMVDGVIVVCRAKANSRGMGIRSSSMLNRVNARILGCVLNAARVTRGGYFREQLRTFYDYHADEPPPRSKR